MQARNLAKEFTVDLGQAVVTENRAGAAGLVGFDALVASPPDGYTIMLLSNTTTTAMHANNRALEIDKTFIPVGGTHVTPMILLVNSSRINVRTLPELIDYLKANPGTDYTSSGPGSPANMGMEAMALQRSLKVTHIPYKGVAPAITDVIAGRVGIVIADSATARGVIQAGTLRPIAAISSVRSPIASDIPTAAEQGIAGFSNDSFAGIIVPLRTPVAVVERLKVAVRKAANGELYGRYQRENGSQNRFTDGPEFREMLERDFERWGRIIRETGIKAQ